MDYENYAVQAIENLCEEYPRAYLVFVGATVVNGEIARLVEQIPGVIRNASLYDWHESIVDTLRRFCHLCSIDPSLVEVYIGQTFESMADEVSKF